jgi:hypothetical protein
VNAIFEKSPLPPQKVVFKGGVVLTPNMASSPPVLEASLKYSLILPIPSPLPSASDFSNPLTAVSALGTWLGKAGDPNSRVKVPSVETPLTLKIPADVKSVSKCLTDFTNDSTVANIPKITGSNICLNFSFNHVSSDAKGASFGLSINGYALDPQKTDFDAPIIGASGYKTALSTALGMDLVKNLGVRTFTFNFNLGDLIAKSVGGPTPPAGSSSAPLPAAGGVIDSTGNFLVGSDAVPPTPAPAPGGGNESTASADGNDAVNITIGVVSGAIVLTIAAIGVIVIRRKTTAATRV